MSVYLFFYVKAVSAYDCLDFGHCKSANQERVVGLINCSKWSLKIPNG